MMRAAPSDQGTKVRGHASGGWLVAASVMFWISWVLMPGVAVTDAAFAGKYGLADTWYGALLRRSPIPIRLDPPE